MGLQTKCREHRCDPGTQQRNRECEEPDGDSKPGDVVGPE